MLSQKNTLVTGAGLLLVAVSAFGQATGTAGATAPPSPVLPPVGLAISETAQVNVVNAATVPPSGGVEPICGGTITFYGGTGGGTVVGVSAFSLRIGQIFSAALSYVSASASGARTVIRAAINLSAVIVPTDAGPVAAPCTLASSIETFDNASGVTHAFASGKVY